MHKTATLEPDAVSSPISASVNVLFPAPGGPVIPMMLCDEDEGSFLRNVSYPSTAFSTREIHRARARVSNLSGIWVKWLDMPCKLVKIIPFRKDVKRMFMLHLYTWANPASSWKTREWNIRSRACSRFASSSAWHWSKINPFLKETSLFMYPKNKSVLPEIGFIITFKNRGTSFSTQFMRKRIFGMVHIREAAIFLPERE